jgi:cystathionine gamma-lyase
VETPSNPELEITDIAAVAHLAHAAGALVAVDNTTATPWLQKPLELGADFSVCSDSKAMCGHSDLLLGHVAAASPLIEGIDRQRTLTGGIAGPMEAWLALRSLATLPLRLERSCANALAIAQFLSSRCDVLYPGLQRHPGHAVAAAQMTQFGPVLGFTLASQEAAENFLERAELITQATSFGGISTSAERRGRWGHDAIVPGFIRLSAGCEDVDDLLADIDQALAHSPHPSKQGTLAGNPGSRETTAR